MKSYPGPPMTLDDAAAARVRLIVWCKGSRYQRAIEVLLAGESRDISRNEEPLPIPERD